jgi:putative aldouronate transport system permease protein
MSSRKLEPFTVVSVIGVSLAVLACAVPFWMIISGSFTSETKLATTGYSFFPDFDFTAYKMIFTGPAVLNAYVASLFITFVGTALSLA